MAVPPTGPVPLALEPAECQRSEEDGVPTYEYRCKKCDERLEVVQSFTDKPLTKHTGCGGELRKVFAAPGIAFKGSGFYKNDSRGGSKGSSSSSGSDSSSSDSGTSSDSSSTSSSDSSSSDKKTSEKKDTKAAKKPAASTSS
jgi:putative FmdB family regulatory protein